MGQSADARVDGRECESVGVGVGVHADGRASKHVGRQVGGLANGQPDGLRADWRLS